MATVIKIENLFKRYIISHKRQERYMSLRDVMADKVKSVFLNNRKPDLGREEFWALKDINLEIKQGDRIGIIGRNGAGKSTLLKTIGRITEPTRGRISIKGRVASLLEVGTGFHPELTGRENVFLNGAILGMTKLEIKRKFSEIVEFAEVEKFLDTPVKRYSSGMQVRLAFAIAANLEPEILLVDEVLAVGDAHFQKKCLGKMDDISSKEGRTILFVSHNMMTIQKLCDKAILLSSGTISEEGEVDTVTNKYFNEPLQDIQVKIKDRKDRKGSSVIRFSSVIMLDENNRIVKFFKSGQNAKLRICFVNNAEKELKNLFIALGIDDLKGNRITHINNEITGDCFEAVSPDINHVDIKIKKLPLMPGRYGITLYSTVNGEIADWIQNAVFFDVEPGYFYNTDKLIPAGQGNFLMDFKFELNEA